MPKDTMQVTLEELLAILTKAWEVKDWSKAKRILDLLKETVEQNEAKGV